MGKKYLDIKDNSLESSVYNVLHGIQEKKLDPVGKEDGDIDNDGDKDASDKYLAKRRKTISKAIKKDKKEGLEDSPNTANSQHLCAKNVVHENWGNGTPISGQHAEPDADGDIAWYDVMFEHGIEKGVSINELKVTKAESHHHSEKKKKKMDEEVDLDEGTYRIGNMKMSGNFKAKNAEDAIKQAMKKGIKVDREFTVYDRDKREFIYKNDKPAVATKGTYKEEVDLDEGKMQDVWQKRNAKSLSVGPFELLRGKPGGVHTIKRSGKVIGDFSYDDEADNFVANIKGMRGQFTGNDIDSLFTHLQKNFFMIFCNINGVSEKIIQVIFIC